MKIFISGQITGIENYWERFNEAEERLTSSGHLVLNPANLPVGFDGSDYMLIAYAMIEVCDAVLMLEGWNNSQGARTEHEKAIKTQKTIIYSTPEAKLEDFI